MKTKKIQETEMSNSLPLKIKLELNIILKCKHRRSILNRLEEYFKTLESNKVTSSYIHQFTEESTKRNQKCLLQREEAITWFKEKIQLLKSSQWAEHPIVKHKIESVEDAMEGKSYNPFVRSFVHVWDLFREAAHAVAAFNYGCPKGVVTISDSLYYQNFFEKVGKGIFIQEQEI